MPQAQILLNGSTNPILDGAINTLVQLDNQNVGSETTFLWAIIDQPPGAADAISNVNIQNPTITPKKEGTYLLQLTVNSDATLVDRNVIGILQVKSRLRVPAAGEKTEAGTPDGWALATNVDLRRVDALVADSGTVAAEASGTLAVGDVVKVHGQSTILSGLPGQQIVPQASRALATTALEVKGQLGVVEGSVASGGSTASGQLAVVRLSGLHANTFSGAAAVGADVFVDDVGKIALAAGTNSKVVGIVAAVPTGSTFKIWLGEVGGAGGAVTAGAGMTGGGVPPTTLDVVANADGTIAVAANDIRAVPDNSQMVLANQVFS